MLTDKKSGGKLPQKVERRRIVRRMKRGARKVAPGGGNGPVLVAMLTLLCMFWACTGLIDGVKMGGPLGQLYCIVTALAAVTLAAALTLAPFLAWGGARAAPDGGGRRAGVGGANENGEVPELLSITQDPDNPRIKVQEYETCGLPPSDWRDRVDELQSALNLTILEVENGQDNQHIKLTTAPPASTLPTKILWTPDCMMDLKPFVLALGVDCAGRQVTWDLHQGHAVLAGMTGSGKSVALRCLLYQCITWGAVPVIVDLKGGVGFSRWAKKCRVITSIEDLLPVLEELSTEMAHREKVLAERHYQDIDEYNARPKAHRFDHIVLAIDEAAELFDKTGAGKAHKAMIEQAEQYITSIARRGRASGLHLLLSTQRPDSNTLPPQIKANVSFSACGMANEVLSKIVLDSTAAADLIPRGKQGCFVVSQGADNYVVTQAYYFDEWRLDYD